MRISHLWVIGSFVLAAVVLWFIGPTRNPFELAFLAAAIGVGALAIVSPLLLKAGIVMPGRVWGYGSIDRPLQGLGVALLAWGGVAGSQVVFVLGALGLAAGSVLELVGNRRRRLT
jgi:hypothetical protein